jgi:hypothetical protein
MSRAEIIDPGCWNLPPSRNEPLSTGANPISSMSRATTAFASASSPARNSAGRSSTGRSVRPAVARSSAGSVFIAFTTRAPGSTSATRSLEVEPSRS